MNINTHSFTPVNGSEGAQVYTAALAKSQQKLEGEAALALLAASAQTLVSMPSSSASPALGSNIDTWV